MFVGFPEDSSGWLFYVPDTKRTYISLDTGSPSGENESYPDDLILNPCHHEKLTRYGHNDSPTNKRNYSGHSMTNNR